MKILNLNFYQRIILQNLCGNLQVNNLSEASIYLRVMDKLRPTDQEMIDTQFYSNEGKFSWQLPEENYGFLEIELENVEADSLVKVMENAQPIRVVDAKWMLEIKSNLTEKTRIVDASNVSQ